MNLLKKILLHSFLLLSFSKNSCGSDLKKRDVHIHRLHARIWTSTEMRNIATLFLERTDINVVKAAIADGALIDYQDQHGNTAVHIAVYQRDYDHANFLIEAYQQQKLLDLLPSQKKLSAMPNKAGLTIKDIYNMNEKESWNHFSNSEPADLPWK